MYPSAAVLTVSLDVGPAQWLVGDSLVPQGFAAYARVLHPAIRWVDDHEVPVRWSQVAAADGRRIDAASTWEAVAGQWVPDGRPGLWDDEPVEGQPAPQQTARLITLLAAFTTDPDHCRYAVWDGYGSLVVPRDGMPRVAFAGRSMLLLRGPLAAAGTSLEAPPFDRRPNLWWPDGRAWCVATDVEATSTIVGGSRECIEALLADDDLETVPACR